MRKIEYIVVHCTGTYPYATIEGMKMHWKSLGWKNPGYHVVIREDGSVVRLADNEEITNGVKGYNVKSLHVAYIGGIKRNGRPGCTLTEDQEKSLATVLSQWAKKYPDAKIVGHRDLSPDADGDGRIEECEWVKQCPCFNVPDLLYKYNIKPYGKD